MSPSTRRQDTEEDSDLTTKQVATLLNVAPSTVIRYADRGFFGRDGVFRLPSGHRRYRRSAVQRIVDQGVSR